MSYLNKYLKYKNKYLELKKNLYGSAGQSKIIFLLGGPGCGKGTVAKIAIDHGYAHISAGELLREETTKNPSSKNSQLILSTMKLGGIVPPEITINLLKNKIKQLNSENKNKILIDGFPRNMENLQVWNSTIDDTIQVSFVLFLQCSKKTLQDRVVNRAEEARKNGHEVRKDDNLDTFELRYGTYEKETLPVIEHFRSKNMIKEVDSNRSKVEVFADVEKIFQHE